MQQAEEGPSDDTHSVDVLAAGGMDVFGGGSERAWPSMMGAGPPMKVCCWSSWEVMTETYQDDGGGGDGNVWLVVTPLEWGRGDERGSGH